MLAFLENWYRIKKITTLNYNAVSATPVYSIYGQSSSGFDMSDNLKTINIGENVTNIPSEFLLLFQVWNI